MRTVIVGLDAFDPIVFEALYEAGKLPNLGRYVQEKSYSRFEVSNPPQSEVSWTSIATGLGPGEHGMFDFVHRLPQSYTLYPSLLPTQKVLGGTRFAPPFNAKTLFDTAVERGYPATSMWWPATFPARPQLGVRTIPGLGAPDILGRLGVGSFFTTDLQKIGANGKIPVYGIETLSKNRFRAQLRGPQIKKGGEVQNATTVLDIEIKGQESAHFKLGKESFALVPGRWSPILTVSFKLGFLVKVRALTRVIVTRLRDGLEIYALPMQIHPLHSPWQYGTPGGFVKQTWKECGPHLTLGWPQDTTALEEEYLSDDQFLQLCEDIFEQRVRALLFHLRQFNEGVLGCVFDTLDRIQHMFRRDRPDVVESWYLRFDRLIGEIEGTLRHRQLLDKTRLVILSDHGFGEFDYKVNLNRWLQEQGHQKVENSGPSPDLKPVNWTATRAYAAGLNGIYLNLAGREGAGIVQEGDRADLLRSIGEELSQWRGPNGKVVAPVIVPGREAFPGSFSDRGPDLFVGYAPGFRASQETGLGGWAENDIESNTDHWGADHCLHAQAVPGVIFSSHNLLRNLANPSFRDVPWMATGIAPEAGSSQAPTVQDESDDQEQIEERLRDLGYL